jgi:DNA gyrase subunit A
MSVIVSRALPDVRDGLKPVHRRIIYAMNQLGMTTDKPHKKSARIVGDVIGKYHPHGDTAVYETMVRMAQDFSHRYTLVDGHGNFGSIDGDSAAAMRYTEARLSKISNELVRDINKDTVDFGDNYDGSEREPLVLPARFPNLLVNGSSGIAVGMATNIPPHNLTEVIDGVLALIENPEIGIKELNKIIKGPDFPTGALILGTEGITNSYNTGRGSIKMRARAEIEEMSSGKHRIIVSEIPYQVNKARLIEKIAELVRDKLIDGITDLRDESDRDGMRIVIELRRDVNSNVVLNNLYKLTQMQSSFGVNMLALVDNKPQILNLKEMIVYYLEHQKVVIRRRTEFDLKKAEERAHILEGLKIALDNLDAVIALIRGSRNAEEAKEGLINRFALTDLQAQAILDMRLQRLTGLEREKIINEYNELLVKIAEYKAILADINKILAIISEELNEVKQKYGDPRRTEITFDVSDIENEDLIPEEDVVVMLTNQGYIKRLDISTYKSQQRGGKGVTGMGTKEDDFVQHFFITNSHKYLMFFTNKGKVYRLKAYEIPEHGRIARGTPIINLIEIDKDEAINAVFHVTDYTGDDYLTFATAQGQIKKSLLSDYENIRRGGIIAINLREGDELISVKLTDGKQDIILATYDGQAIRFNENDVRVMGRTTSGVRGITLAKGDRVVGMEVVDDSMSVLVVTHNGYGKKTPATEYREQTRGGKGVKTLNVTKKTGNVVGMKTVTDDLDIMIVTNRAMVIRLPMKTVSSMGRYTQGVKLINVGEDNYVTSVAKIEAENEEEINETENN